MAAHNQIDLGHDDHHEVELTFSQYFRNIYDGVMTTFKGMMITFKYVWGHKPVTLEYPEVREVLPEHARARLFNDVQNCIACEQCSTACPVDCIYIASTKKEADAPAVKTKNGMPIKLELRQYTIDTALCCTCGLCTTVCPTGSLAHTTDYEFSQFALGGFKYDYLAPEVKEWRNRLIKD